MSVIDIEVTFDHGTGYGSSDAKREVFPFDYLPNVGDLVRVRHELRVVDNIRHVPIEPENTLTPRIRMETFGESDYEYAPEETQRLLKRYGLAPESDTDEEVRL